MSENMKKIGVAVLGAGTVGGGTVKLLQRQSANFENKIGCDIELKKVLVRNMTKSRPGIPQELLTDDFEQILGDESIQIIVELMGGIHPAYEYITAALKAGKNVVTANKDLIAAHGREIFELASQNGVDFRYEAAVAGGIPVISPLLGGLAGNDIQEIIGIVNGTTNFILSKMSAEGMEFSDALAEATRLGYAEADPTADIEGLDAARKCAILATLGFHSWVSVDDVMVEGITTVTAADIGYAKEMGYVIKLLAIAREADGQIVTSVYPALIPQTHPLAAVNDSYNAVYITGDAVGNTMFYGRGAGEFPTASAVLGDIMKSAAAIDRGCTGASGSVIYRDLPLKARGEIRNRFFLRMRVEDQPGVLASVASVFATNRVSILQLLQKNKGEGAAELIIVTAKARERDFHNAIRLLEEMELIQGVSHIIRVHGNSHS